MNKKRTKRSEDPVRNDPSYQKLVQDLRAVIEVAKAKGVDFGARSDLLTCRACGAYEDEGIHTGRMVMLRRGKRAKTGTEFIVLSHKEKSRWLKGGVMRRTADYEFICGICGAFQAERFLEDFTH